MKKIVLLLALIATTLAHSQTMDPMALALCRAQQCAQEMAFYNKFSKSEDNRFQCVADNFKKKEKFSYEKNQPFRYFETSNNLLNGKYEIYYRSGKIFLKTVYKNNYLKDSTQIFYENGNIKTRIVYKTQSAFEVTHYYENGNKKQVISSSQPVECTDLSNLYNSKRSPKTVVYYNDKGVEISAEEFKALNKDDD